MISIATLRQPGSAGFTRDRAMLDLLQLAELNRAPGQVTTRELRLLWHCSQSQVSRRLAAINELPGWRVQWQQGRTAEAWIGPTIPPAKELPPSHRQRWERLRLAWAGGEVIP
jgi:hypothetical protein